MTCFRNFLSNGRSNALSCRFIFPNDNIDCCSIVSIMWFNSSVQSLEFMFMSCILNKQNWFSSYSISNSSEYMLSNLLKIENWIKLQKNVLFAGRGYQSTWIRFDCSVLLTKDRNGMVSLKHVVQYEVSTICAVLACWIWRLCVFLWFVHMHDASQTFSSKCIYSSNEWENWI